MSTSNQRGVKVTKGYRVRGSYAVNPAQPAPFSGVVERVEADTADLDVVRVYIALDADVVEPSGYVRRERADGLIMLCRNLGGGRLERTDVMYSGVVLNAPK